ncbi:type II restriction enzyme NspV homolog [Calothrix sp. NIES-4071]|nr:type II restriction enzyme NspV homolog [Calothrix sp. NIES-4071]BAZ62178.1 type II restriction enzyme NspV homolog [Calothrix sp. NIES-4105]
MQIVTKNKKLEYGDFQTPLELCILVCQKLVKLNVNPDVILEPTCGVGNFIDAAAKSFKSAKHIIGVEANPCYLEQFDKRKKILPDIAINIKQADFF